MKKRFLLGMIFVCCLIIQIAGCKPDTGGRLAISGTVQLDGVPLASGNITFRSVTGTGCSAGTSIKDGKYIVEAKNGLLPGDYLVALESQRSTGKKVKVPSPGAGPDLEIDETINVIPDEFGPRGTQKVTVKENQKNIFDISISKGMTK